MDSHTDVSTSVVIICVLGVLTALSIMITCLDCDNQYEDYDNESHNIKRKHGNTKKSSRRKSRSRKKLQSNCGVESKVVEPQKHQTPSQMGLSQMVGSQMVGSQMVGSQMGGSQMVGSQMVGSQMVGSQAGLFAQPRRPSFILINPPVMAVQMIGHLPIGSHGYVTPTIDQQRGTGTVTGTYVIGSTDYKKGTGSSGDEVTGESISCGQKKRGRRHSTARPAQQGYEKLDINSVGDSHSKWKPTQMNYEHLSQKDDGDNYNSLIQGNSARHNNVDHDFSNCVSYCTISSQNSDTEDVDVESHQIMTTTHKSTLDPYYNIV